MKLLKVSLLIMLSTLALNANAQGIALPPQPEQPAATDCISKQDIQTFASDFSQFQNLVGKEYCNDNSHTWHLLSSLMFMKRTAFAADMPKSKDELFSGRFASDWYNYYIGRIDNMEVVSSCQKGVVAYVYAFGGKTMYVCPMALTDTFSSLDRASVMMHEARHIDGFPHMTCTKGPRAGIQGACDKKIADGGSYAVTVETYAQLAKYATDLHPALRAYSKASSVVYADEAFENTVVINRAQQLMVMTEGLDFHAVDATTLTAQKLGKAPVAGHIIKRAAHMVLMPDDKTLPSRYVFARNEGEISQAASDLFAEYNAQTPTERANLVDVHVGTQWTARVFKTSVRFACDPKAATTKDINLAAGATAAGLLYPTGYDRAAKQTQLITTAGDLFEIGCQGTSAYIKASTVKFDQKYKRVYKVANQVFGLTADGALFSVQGDRSTPLALGLDSKVIEIAPAQSYEFFDVQ